MLEQTYLMARQEQHTQDLMGEAQRERASGGQAGRAGLQCRLCLRLGRALMALGARLERYAGGGLAPQLAGGEPAATL